MARLELKTEQSVVRAAQKNGEAELLNRTEEKEYLLGTRDDETRRLGFQHRVWAECTFALWERAGFGPGQTIVDLGCGPGFASIDLANLVGAGGRVIALDESKRFITFLKSEQESTGLGNIETRVGDVQSLDLPAESIDGAYARWVLCFVPKPESVVAAVANALKPNGTFAVMDYFNYPAFTFAPRSAALDRVVRAVIESWRSHGGDLDIMLRVPELMAARGLEVTDVRPIVRIARPGSALWEWPATFFRNFLPVLQQGGFLTSKECKAFEEDWQDRSANPESILITPPMLDVIGIKKPK